MLGKNGRKHESRGIVALTFNEEREAGVLARFRDQKIT